MTHIKWAKFPLVFIQIREITWVFSPVNNYIYLDLFFGPLVKINPVNYLLVFHIILPNQILHINNGAVQKEELDSSKATKAS